MEFELPDEERKAGVCVNGGEGAAHRVLRALGAKLEAPQPPVSVDRTVD